MKVVKSKSRQLDDDDERLESCLQVAVSRVTSKY